MEQIDYIIPEWALCPLIYGDYSGLNDEEIVIIDKFTKDVVKEHGNGFFSHLDDLGFTQKK